MENIKLWNEDNRDGEVKIKYFPISPVRGNYYELYIDWLEDLNKLSNTTYTKTDFPNIETPISEWTSPY